MTDPVTIERVARIMNPAGLHARPAAEFVKLANRFQANITVAKNEMSVNGKSIMGVMMLAAECGSEITIRAAGSDAPEAVRALAALVARGFDEPEERPEEEEEVEEGAEGHV
ncbi:MAG: HPr family phosphocarrier protein [Gemmatimonadetes bacterium]|nr:HPr family phosphocarrier protein [Gemmatimonadota bacterium]